MTDRDTPAANHAVGIAGGWMTPPPPETFQQLQNLVQAYALFGDSAQQARLSELFTTNAEWDGTSLGYGTAVGCDEIAALVCGHHKVDQPMMHLPGPALLTAISESEVHGVTWCTATRWTNGTTRPVIYFYYEDRFRRRDDGTWQFARRLLRAAFPS